MGWIGGTYLAETSKRLPRTLYWVYLPPWVGTPFTSLTASDSSMRICKQKRVWEERRNRKGSFLSCSFQDQMPNRFFGVTEAEKRKKTQLGFFAQWSWWLSWVSYFGPLGAFERNGTAVNHTVCGLTQKSAEGFRRKSQKWKWIIRYFWVVLGLEECVSFELWILNRGLLWVATGNGSGLVLFGLVSVEHSV